MALRLSLRLIRDMGQDAANIPADANVHAPSNQHRDALHDVRRADEAGHDRAARSKLRRTDLPVRALRLRRKLFEGTLDRTATRSARQSLPASARVPRHAPQSSRGRSEAANLRR